MSNSIWWDDKQRQINREIYWEQVYSGGKTAPRLKPSPNPTRAQRRWTEQMRITKSLMQGDGYMQQHYSWCLSLASAMAKWDERNPEVTP